MKNPPKPVPPEKDPKNISTDPKSIDFSDKKSSKAPKKTTKSKENNLTLQTVFGLTSHSHNNLALNPTSGEIAYPAGSMIVIYNAITNKQTKFIFSPNKKPFTCLTFSKEGKFLLAGEGICKNPEINIWDLRHDNPPVCLKGHKFGIEKILFSPNQQYLVSIGDENDKGLFVWDWEKEMKLTMNKMSKKINGACFNSTGTLLITAGVQHLKFWPLDSEGKIILTKPKEGEGVFIIEGKSAILGQKFQNKTFLDVCAADGHIFALDAEGVLCVLSEQRKLEKWMDLKVKSAFTLQLTVSHVVCGCSDGIIRYFDINSLHHVATFPKPPALGCYNIEKTNIKASVILQSPETFADVVCLLTDELRNRLVALYSDRTVFIWDVHDLEKVNVKRSFLNHNGTIHDIQTLENSSYEVTFFATGSTDQTIRIWNLLEEEKGMPNLPGLRRNLYSKNLTRILYLGDNFEHFKAHKDETESTNTSKQIRCLKCSHDGQYLASGDLDGVLRIFSLITFSKIVELVSHDQEILCMDFTPENPLDVFFLATGSRDRLIHIYNCADEFKLLTTLEDHNSSISALQFAYHKAKNNILLMSCGVDKSMIFREYRAKEAKIFFQIHLEIDKNSKFFTMDLNHESNIAVLGQEKKLLLWSIDEMKVKGTIETKEEDKSSGKFVPLDNLKIAVDSTGTYIAVSNNDKVVRIRDFAGGMVAKICCGDIITSLAFTQNSKYLITASSKGCIYVWKLSSEIKSNIEKKKQQLGLWAKRLKEVLGKSKDLTLDSFWIEEEIKHFLKSGDNSNSVNQLLDDLSKPEPNNTGSVNKPKEEQKKAKLKELNAKPKELFMKPEEIELDFGGLKGIELSNIVNNQDLPNWAQSQIKPPFELAKIDHNFKLSEDNPIKEENSAIIAESVQINNAIPNWFAEKPVSPVQEMIKGPAETDFIEIDFDEKTNIIENEEKEEKDNEIYQNKQEKEGFSYQVEESQDPFVQKNYFDLDKDKVAGNSPLRVSLSSHFREFSQKKQESPLIPEERKIEVSPFPFDNKKIQNEERKGLILNSEPKEQNKETAIFEKKQVQSNDKKPGLVSNNKIDEQQSKKDLTVFERKQTQNDEKKQALIFNKADEQSKGREVPLNEKKPQNEERKIGLIPNKTEEPIKSKEMPSFEKKQPQNEEKKPVFSSNKAEEQNKNKPLEKKRPQTDDKKVAGVSNRAEEQTKETSQTEEKRVTLLGNIAEESFQNKNVISFVRNPKKDMKTSILDLNEISQQMELVNRNIEQVQINMKKNDLPNPLFDSQIDAIKERENIKTSNDKKPVILSIDKVSLKERNKEELFEKPKEPLPFPKPIEDEYIDDFENAEIEENLDVEKNILNESRKIKENKGLDNPDFHELIVRTLNPVKEQVLITEKEFKSSRNASPGLKQEEGFERRMDVFFEGLNQSINEFIDEYNEFKSNEKKNKHKEEISLKLERKIEITKSMLDRLGRKDGSVLRLSEIEGSNVFGLDSQNKSISNYIVDQSRDILEIYSKQLIDMVKSQIGNK